jgi:glycolate oxidase iron-sulfur subunit
MTVSTPREQNVTIPLMHFSSKDKPSSDIINTCVHCGLCLSSCPTYRETGLEMSSPRGRIYLMKAVDEGRIGLEPSPKIPSGDPTGPIGPRPLWQQALRGAVFGTLFKRMPLFRAFTGSMWLYQKSGAQWFARKSGMLKLMGMEETEQMLPPISGKMTVPQGQVYPAEGTRRASVALITGCIMSTAFAEVHEATIRVLQKNGVEVILPPGQGCCGALHTHGGDLDGGRELARVNIQAFEGLGVDAIIVNAAGCGGTLKEYGHLLHDDPEWHGRAEAFSSKVRDVHEYLAGIELNRAGLGRLDVSVTYQEPCHLAHAQRISVQPRTLLKAIPGLELREMHESALC